MELRATADPGDPRLERDEPGFRRPPRPSIHRSALLVVDVQDSFRATGRWRRRSNRKFESKVKELIAAFRSAALPVFFFMDHDDDEPFRPGSPWFKLMEFVEPRAGEPVIVKTSRNCFSTTGLDVMLRRLDVARVTICGIKTEQCCETTARVASDLGYAVDFVTEATLTFPIGHPRGGPPLPAAAVVERTEYALHDRFARIVTVAEVREELRRESGRPTPQTAEGRDGA